MFISLRLKHLILPAVLAICIISAITICIFAGSKPTSLEASTSSAKEIKLPILMYHGIRKDNSAQNKYVISPDEFESDLKYIKENGYETIVVADLLEYFDNGKALPEKPIMITFDDGCLNNYTYAFPLLKKYNAKMILSPIGKCIDEYSKNGDKNPAYAQADWNTLREMSDSGLVEIQNHTYNMHASIGRVGASQKIGESDEEYRKNLSEDLKKFNERMKAELNITPTAFTYPYGAISKNSPDIIKELGFRASFDCSEKLNHIKSEADLHKLHRFIRPHNKSSAEILSKIE